MSGTQAVEVMIFGTGGFVGSLMFTVQSITVGRDPAAMVRLDDPSVSLKHALLVLEAGSLRVKDLGSRTGTRVNGIVKLPYSEKHAAAGGLKITRGHDLMEYFLHGGT